MERLKKRIIVTSFASNVARMESVFYCAEKTGRQISLVGRSMHRIYKAAKKCGFELCQSKLNQAPFYFSKLIEFKKEVSR